MKKKDLDDYYRDLNSYFLSNGEHCLPNSNRAHNATILRFMLDNANSINMYCGEMSIFRESFYNHINNSSQENVGTVLKSEIIDAITRFISKSEACLNVIIENFKTSYFGDLISSKVFKDGIKAGKIKLRQLDKTLVLTNGLSHCTFTDNGIVRIEMEQEPHSGLCTVNLSEDLSKILHANYGILEKSSTPIKAEELI